VAARLILGALLCGLLVGACAPASSGQAGGQRPTPRTTPQSSLSPQMAGTVSLLRSALRSEGIRIDRPIVPYQPAEPAGIADTPRAVLQADVGDPNGGYVMVYESVDAATAARRGTEFATYLESGFGQTNYPLDAQFSLSQVGSTLIFTWWSSERSADRERARAAFDAVARVGDTIEIVK
jgi:hypothetical protein